MKEVGYSLYHTPSKSYVRFEENGGIRWQIAGWPYFHAKWFLERILEDNECDFVFSGGNFSKKDVVIKEIHYTLN